MALKLWSCAICSSVSSFGMCLNCPLYFTSTTPEEYLETSQTSMFFFAKKLHHRCLAVLQIRLCTLRLFIPSKQKWNDFLFAKHSILAKINNKFWKFVEIGIWKYDDINIYYSIETFFFNILRRDQVLFSSSGRWRRVLRDLHMLIWCSAQKTSTAIGKVNHKNNNR